MTLQLLIAHYHEPEDMVAQLLDSIAAQQGAETPDVLICNDGTDVPLSDDFLARYPFASYMERPHSGVSATRNALLEASTGDYLMFLDSDDLFFSLIGLHVIDRWIAKDFDVMISDFIEEHWEHGRLVGYIPRKNDPFFLHGKVFRRQYLIDNGIRWDDSLTTSGDNYFLWQALSLTDRIAYCPEPFYMWKYNPGSVCRGEDDHFLKDYPKHLRTYVLLCDRFTVMGRRDLATTFATMMAYESYVGMHSSGWNQWPYKDEAMGILREGLARYGDLCSEMPEDDRRKLYHNVLHSHMIESMSGGIMLADEWISNMRRKS